VPAWQFCNRLIVLVTVAFAVLWPALLYADDAGEILGRFKTDKKYHALWVPVIIDGQKRIFLVDTGSTITMFDKKLLSGQPLSQIRVEYTDKDLYPLSGPSFGEDRTA
jgi:hypothetical protein